MSNINSKMTLTYFLRYKAARLHCQWSVEVLRSIRQGQEDQRLLLQWPAKLEPPRWLNSNSNSRDSLLRVQEVVYMDPNKARQVKVYYVSDL